MSQSHRSGSPAWVRKGLRRLGRPILVLLIALGALYVVISPGVAEHFVFFPVRSDPGPPPVLAGVAGEDVEMTASDGVRLHAWWYHAGPRAPAVLLFHGNAENIAGPTPMAEAYVRRGISVFLLDYRGYGRSEGNPTEAGVYRDADASLEWVLGQGIRPGRVVAHGWSLGAAVAVGLASGRNDLGGAILESAFTSLDQIAAVAYPFLPGFLFRRLRGHFDNLSRIAELEIPVLIVHGSRDRLIPVAMGRELYERAPEPREWFEVRGADHNDMFLVGGEPYFDRLAGFVLDVTGPSDSRSATATGPDGT